MRQEKPDSSTTSFVKVGGLEPPKPKQQIYSLPQLSIVDALSFFFADIGRLELHPKHWQCFMLTITTTMPFFYISKSKQKAQIIFDSGFLF